MFMSQSGLTCWKMILTCRPVILDLANLCVYGNSFKNNKKGKKKERLFGAGGTPSTFLVYVGGFCFG